MLGEHVEALLVTQLGVRNPQCIHAMFRKPLVGVEVEELLAPQHPGECLPQDISCVLANTHRRQRPIERVSLMPPSPP